MELHYILNDTMRPLAERYFLPSLPKGFVVREHDSRLWTSGNFDQDNYTALLIERTKAIQHEIMTRLDGGLMLWCDVDLIFFRDCVPDLELLATGKDLLFQKETTDPKDPACNFGIQLIRRTPASLAFYARLSLLQRMTENAHDQPWGNRLLLLDDAPCWGHLPATYSSETNGGVKADSVLYHANGTVTDSMNRKENQLDRALAVVGRG